MKNDIFYNSTVKDLLLWPSLVLIVMNIPKLSTGIMILITAGFVLRWLVVRHINEAFLLRMIVLLFFATTYYFVMAYYGYTDIGSSVKYGIYIVGMYVIGFAVGNGSKPFSAYRSIWMLLSVIVGSVLFSFMSVYKILSVGHKLEVASRAVPSFWTGGDPINGPGLGAMASLGICFAPLLFMGTRDGIEKAKYYSLMVVMSILVVMGVYANLALQNRSPFVALVIAFIVVLLSVLYSGRIKMRSFIFSSALVLSSFVLIAYLITATALFSHFTIFSRFATRGLETTGRSTAWLLMIKGLFSSLTGGRSVYIGLDYVHNLWLDVAFDTGIVPFVLLLIFHGSHVSRFIELIKSSSNLTMTLTIMCISVSFLSAFLVEPALNFSAVYFASSCFFLGVILRISEDARKSID